MNETTNSTDTEQATLTRPNCPALDAILGHKFPVLHDGFVRVVDYMGNDQSIVNAARTSYGKGTKTVSDNETLLRFMLRHGHTSPTEMAAIKLHVRVPMDTWRQWIRHRTAQTNEYSTRYSEAIDSQHEVSPDEWRTQSTTNRQGSGEPLGSWETIPDGAKQAAQKWCLEQRITKCDTPGLYLSIQQNYLQSRAREIYEERLRFGVAREQARQDLPLSTYTEAVWKIDLHNLLHFLSKRMAPDAQFEIRQYANAIAKIVALWVPQTWKAFEDYKLNAVTLSALEIEAIRNGVDGWLNTRIAYQELEKLSPRELREFKAKLQRLGLRLDGTEGGES